MSEPLVQPFVPLEEDQRWALVQRIASSRHFNKAPQLREILFYICRRALAEHALSIGEQEIGSKVLGRRPDFNPNEDNIVRVQVRHLRKKLEDYFLTDGVDEAVVLTIPKGAYLPHFGPRPEHEPEPRQPAAVEILTPAPSLSPAAPQPKGSRRTLALTVLFSIFLTAAAAFVLWSKKAPVPAAEAKDVFWSRIFVPGRETTVVAADTNLVMIQDILDVDLPLQDYLNGGYPEELIRKVPDRKLQDALRLIAARQYTSLGDAILTSKFLGMSRRYNAAASLRYSRYVNVREFKTGNFILIGSRRGIPWEQLFESQLNFCIEEDGPTHHYQLRNRNPLPGEHQVYSLSMAGKTDQDTYADIALLPNLGGNGYVLILAGIDMAATEAAGEFVTRPDFGATLNTLLGGKAVYFEILLEAKATAGTGGAAKIVSYRRIEGPRPASQ